MSSDPALVSEALQNQENEVKSAGGHLREEVISTTKSEDERKSTWWPNCTHARYSKLAQRKFRDRLVILWKCRRCPKQIREVIDIDMNSREVFIKSTKSALPRRYDNDPTA